MKSPCCDREQDALDALRTGRWAEGLDEELRAHVTSCMSCTDLVLVASALLGDSGAAVREAHVPQSGVVWFRIQRRARQESLRAASRTITTIQWISVAVAAIVFLAILRPDWSAVLTEARKWSTPLLLGAAIWLTLAPLAAYFALTEDSPRHPEPR